MSDIKEEVFDLFLILDDKEIKAHRGDEKKDSKFFRKIEEKYIDGIKDFGSRFFEKLKNPSFEVEEININFQGDLSSKIDFGLIEIGAGMGATVGFKLKRIKSSK